MSDDEVVDALEIGRCGPMDLPGWLRTTATAMKIRWDRFEPRSNVDTKPIEHWLVTG